MLPLTHTHSSYFAYVHVSSLAAAMFKTIVCATQNRWNSNVLKIGIFYYVKKGFFLFRPERRDTVEWPFKLAFCTVQIQRNDSRVCRVAEIRQFSKFRFLISKIKFKKIQLFKLCVKPNVCFSHKNTMSTEQVTGN